MKHLTRLMSLLLALMLCLSCAAFGEEELTEAEKLAIEVQSMVLPTPELPIVEEPMTLTVNFPRNVDHGDYNEMFYIKAVEKVTGIKLDVTGIDPNGWDEKLSLAFLSGDYSDIYIAGVSFADASTYGQAGMLLPLEDLIAEYAPNAQKILDTLPETRRNVTSTDGHIYMMPAYDSGPRDMLMNGTYDQYLNGEWLETLGLEVPTTLDEFYDMLVAFKTGDPNGNGEADEIPWSFVYDGDGYNMVLGAFGFVNLRHDIIDDQYVYVPAQENFRYYLEFMNKLYTEGLVDANIFEQTTEEYGALMSTKTVGFTPNNGVGYIGSEDFLKTVNLSPLTSEYNETPVHPGRAQEVDKYGMVITDKCTEEEAIAAIKLLDYFYSEEGTYLSKCGPEYGAWGDMIEGGYVRTVNEDGSYSYELVFDKEEYNESYWTFRVRNALMQQPFFCTKAHTDVIVGSDVNNNHITEVVNECGMLKARRVGYPQMVTFTEDEKDILAPYVLMDSYVDQMVAKFITGEIEITDETWQNYLDQLDMMDLASLVEVRQAAYDRWNA